MPAGSSLTAAALVEQATGNNLFLAVILGTSKDCLADSRASARYVIANVIGFDEYEMRKFRGPIIPSSAGDGSVTRAPILKGDALILLSKDHADDHLIAWNGEWFLWYPWASKGQR
jgi:hypothetical protein